MSTISQSVLSTQYVSVLVTAQGGSPTGDSVEMAFVPSGNPQPGDWNAASWAAQGNLPATQAIAQCLVGPDGVITLAAGTYNIWVQISDHPETPVLPAGTLSIF